MADRSHIKICVSCRPELTFERTFNKFPGLLLQDLTVDDITTYVNTKLSTHERMIDLEYEEPGIGKRLASQIVNKASGVFLWVKLVVASLLEGIGNYDDGSELERRLNDLPEDLEDLYRHMLQRIKPSWYLAECFRLLLLVKTAYRPLTILQLSFAVMDDREYALKCKMDDLSLERQWRLCIKTDGRIKSRCLGLIEAPSNPSGGELSKRHVYFLHQSVNDFLETPITQSEIKNQLESGIETPEVQLMRALLLDLKTFKTRVSPSDLNIQKGLTYDQWVLHLLPLIFDFLYYAKAAEKVTKRAEVFLIDEFNNAMGILWTPMFPSENFERHWFRDNTLKRVVRYLKRIQPTDPDAGASMKKGDASTTLAPFEQFASSLELNYYVNAKRLEALQKIASGKKGSEGDTPMFIEPEKIRRLDMVTLSPGLGDGSKEISGQDSKKPSESLAQVPSRQRGSRFSMKFFKAKKEK